MSFMTATQIKRMQFVKKLLQDSQSGIKDHEVPILAKELEKLRDQYADEEFVIVPEEKLID